MEDRPRQEELFTRYLLGELTEEERGRVEESYFTDDAAFERFLAAKDELLDAHARGELDGGRRERFERHFLTTRARRRRADEARELVEFATAAAAQAVSAEDVRPRGGGRSPWASFLAALRARLRPLQIGLAAAVIVTVIGGSWAVIRGLRTRPPETVQTGIGAPGAQQQRGPETAAGRDQSGAPPLVSPAPSQPAGKAGDEVAKNPADERPASDNAGAPERPPSANAGAARARTPAAGAHVASITLAPVLVRSGGAPNALTLRPETGAVRLRLQVPPRREKFASFRAVLTTVEGEELRAYTNLRAGATREGALVTVSLDPALLRKQDYIVRLDGVTEGGASAELAEYYFRAARSAADPRTPRPPTRQPCPPALPRLPNPQATPPEPARPAGATRFLAPVTIKQRGTLSR